LGITTDEIPLSGKPPNTLIDQEEYMVHSMMSALNTLYREWRRSDNGSPSLNFLMQFWIPSGCTGNKHGHVSFPIFIFKVF